MAKHDEPLPDSTGTLDNEPDVQQLEKESPLEHIESELEDATSSPSHYEIVSIPADYTLEGLATKMKRGQLKIPGFQRKFVWTQRQASRLIESFLLGLPVPALFLYADPDTGDQQVIDGQQRLMSVVQFFTGSFKNANMSREKGRKCSVSLVSEKAVPIPAALWQILRKATRQSLRNSMMPSCGRS